MGSYSTIKKKSRQYLNWVSMLPQVQREARMVQSPQGCFMQEEKVGALKGLGQVERHCGLWKQTQEVGKEGEEKHIRWRKQHFSHIAAAVLTPALLIVSIQGGPLHKLCCTPSILYRSSNDVVVRCCGRGSIPQSYDQVSVAF